MKNNPLNDVMPSILRHEGVWVGEYQHINIVGEIIDQHRSRVECVFPDTGDEVYIQKNSFTWEDGREQTSEFAGVLEGERIFWDTLNFRGYGWVASPTIFLLELDRKDQPGASFSETIVLGSSGRDRARTWHWFKDGKCFQRTLCNERLIKR